jgi:hypothetical protein
MQGGFYCKPRGTVQIESTQVRWFLEKSVGRLDLLGGGQRGSIDCWKTTLGSKVSDDRNDDDAVRTSVSQD